MATRIDFSAMEWIKPAPGAQYKAVALPGQQIRLVEFSKDFVEPGWCEKGHIGYLIEGEMELRFEDHVESFSAGDGVAIPVGPAFRHKAKILTEKARLILVEDVAE